jgi:hypothetical protein
MLSHWGLTGDCSLRYARPGQWQLDSWTAGQECHVPWGWNRRTLETGVFGIAHILPSYHPYGVILEFSLLTTVFHDERWSLRDWGICELSPRGVRRELLRR